MLHHLPVKFQDEKFQDPKFKHENFGRIDMKHSYCSNYFIICLPSIFSVVEIIIGRAKRAPHWADHKKRRCRDG